jgi:hypothetical protein
MKCIPALLLPAFLAGTASGQHADAVQWRVEDGGNGHWYQAVLVPCDVDWGEANAAAQAMPGNWYLATVHTEAENAFIYRLVDESAYWNTAFANAAGPWLGGYSSCFACNDWRWVTGEPWTYARWGPSEPFGNGDRLGLFGHRASMGDTWNDIQDGYDIFGYVVETDSTPLGMARVYGSGVNPAGSLTILGGGPSVGGTLVIGLHDPVGTMGEPSLTRLFFSTNPDPRFPCGGTLLPDLGLAAPGAAGEALIDLVPPNPVVRVTGPLWTGTQIQIAARIPRNAALIGQTFYGQGALVDPSGRVGLTAAIELRVGL